MGGSIIINRNAALLVAVTDPSFYDSLKPQEKTAVDTIDAKGPGERTKDDLVNLMNILRDVCKRG